MQMIPVRTFPRLLASLSTLATLLLGIPSVSAAPTGQPPLPHAIRIISLGPDNSTRVAGKIGGVMQPWLSDHEVLHFRGSQLYRYDVAAKTDTLLAGLTHQVKSSPCFLYFLEASPNGQQVFWGMSANNPIFVATVDGARREQWDGDGGMTQPFWCAGGKHWLQFHFGGSPTALHFTKIERHSLEAPQTSETFQSPPPGLNGLDILAAPSADEVIARTPDVVKFETSKPSKGVKQADGSMAFTFTDTPTLRRAQTILVWNLHEAQPLHRYAIDLPGKVYEVAVSPDGERAAWLLQDGTGKIGAMALWVSKLDGTGLRKLGNFGAGGKASYGSGMNFPLQVVWVPGGKKVSFLYGGALWTVPADQ